MAFDAAPDPLVARLPFGGVWLGLDDPAERRVCDPFSVRARLALYRLLVERVGGAAAFGAGHARSPFWGYAAQLAWQHGSGRLAAPGAAVTDAIAPASWWGVCNFSLSVVPYLAAMAEGAVPTLTFAPAAPADAYSGALAAWREAIRAMRAAGGGDDPEPVRRAVWRAHVASIETAVRRHRDAERALPGPERRFARGWVRMVDLFSAAAMRTDLERIAAPGGAVMPGRVLDGEAAAADLPRPERSAVRRIGALADRPPWRWALERRLWRRIMRARPARDDLDGMLAAVLGRGRTVDRVRALAYAAMPGALAARARPATPRPAAGAR
jgi:Leg1